MKKAPEKERFLSKDKLLFLAATRVFAATAGPVPAHAEGAHLRD
jgi:hypothetical protein